MAGLSDHTLWKRGREQRLACCDALIGIAASVLRSAKPAKAPRFGSLHAISG